MTRVVYSLHESPLTSCMLFRDAFSWQQAACRLQAAGKRFSSFDQALANWMRPSSCQVIVNSSNWLHQQREQRPESSRQGLATAQQSAHSQQPKHVASGPMGSCPTPPPPPKNVICICIREKMWLSTTCLRRRVAIFSPVGNWIELFFVKCTGVRGCDPKD